MRISGSKVRNAHKALDLATGLAPLWASSDPKEKEQLQKLVFPEGIVYDREKDHYRTERINEIFALITDLTRDSAEKEKGQTGNETCSSLSARKGRLSSNF